MTMNRMLGCRSLPTTLGVLLGLAMAIGLPVTGQAQPTVDPTTAPFLTLAPYVLKSSNLEARIGNADGGTRAYRPWFENGAWSGDLIEYAINADGVRLVRGDIGRYPRDGVDWRGTQELWSARYAFPDFIPYDHSGEISPNWECKEEDATYWTKRNLFTVNGGVRVPFVWNTLSAAQRLAVDGETAANSALASQAYASPILNYVRGDRSKERCKSGGNYRWRFSVLGAIVNSTPVYVPVGADGLVVVGANDGMLHGFNASNGQEVFGFVPSMLLPKVGLLRISPYRPTHFVDGELRYRDIGTSSAPRHIVAGGLGAGGRGLLVLDVTTPTAPAVREVSGSEGAHNGGTYDGRFGNIHGRPTIARLAAGGGRWYVVTGNGFGSVNGTAQLALVPVDGGAPEFIATNGATGNGLAPPSLVDASGNGIADFAYAGDLQGNLWRFDLNTRTSTRLFSAGAGKPITVEPDISRHPDGLPGFMVYFGTGSLLSRADVSDTTPQTVYGIWDRGDGLAVAETRLASQTLVHGTVTYAVPQTDNLCGTPETEESTSTLRFVVDPQTPDWSGVTPNLGWRVDLPRPGERLIGHPQIRAQRLQFVTTNPYDMVDYGRIEEAGSGSWIMQLDLATGANAASPAPLFDLNKNCALDTEDGLPSTRILGGASVEKGAYPVGVALGAFHIAQPAFARVRFSTQQQSVVDGVYVNALQLPLRDDLAETMLHGPLDVTTDSPGGVAHSSVWPEPWKEPFDGGLFPESSAPTKPFLRADGIGHRVNGHAASYNFHHGVDYVDYFDLEPRRGDWRLDVASMYRDNAGVYRRIAPRVSQRELNRVTEVGIADNQRFIVVVANADLSQANEIQIGCRRWPVYEYQTLMMQALRRPPAEAMAQLAADGLIFTLSGSYNPIRPVGGQCPDGRVPTLRVTPTARIGGLDNTMATLPGCVANAHRYGGSRPNEHLTRKPALHEDGSFAQGKGPSDLYLDDPHVTRNQEGTGYRWRNGALTVQLLAVNGDNTPAFVLQPATELPRGPGMEGQDRGWGGAYARAFTLSSGGNVTPINASPPPAGTSSGLLYEGSQFWHWGDMARFQQRAGGTRISPVCYGAAGNLAPLIMFETEWYTPGSYKQLTQGLTEEIQLEYSNLLAQLKSSNPAVVEAALVALAQMFDANPNLADYHRLRHYVPNSKQLREHHLIRMDRESLSDPAVDGTPADVVDIERDLLPSLGPNYQLGRRSWIDLTPAP
jgi:hypothetical protein